MGMRRKVMVGVVYYPKIMPDGKVSPWEWDVPRGVIIFVEGDTTINEVKHEIMRWQRDVCAFDIWFFPESIHEVHKLLERLPFHLRRKHENHIHYTF